MRTSELQMTDASTWSGLTTYNHLGAVYSMESGEVYGRLSKLFKQQKKKHRRIEILNVQI